MFVWLESLWRYLWRWRSTIHYMIDLECMSKGRTSMLWYIIVWHLFGHCNIESHSIYVNKFVRMFYISICDRFWSNKEDLLILRNENVHEMNGQGISPRFRLMHIMCKSSIIEKHLSEVITCSLPWKKTDPLRWQMLEIQEAKENSRAVSSATPNKFVKDSRNF